MNIKWHTMVYLRSYFFISDLFLKVSLFAILFGKNLTPQVICRSDPKTIEISRRVRAHIRSTNVSATSLIFITFRNEARA